MQCTTVSSTIKALPASRVKLGTATSHFLCSTLLLRGRNVGTILLVRCSFVRGGVSWASKPCKHGRYVLVVRCFHESLPERLHASTSWRTALPEWCKRVVRMRSFPEGRYLVSSGWMLLQSLPEADRFASASHQRCVVTALLPTHETTTLVYTVSQNVYRL